MNLNDFLDSEEASIIESFLETGYIIFPLDSSSTVDKIRNEIFHFSKDYLELSDSTSQEDFFNQSDKFIPHEQLNDLKLKLIALTSKDFKFHAPIYHMAKKYLDYIVGNEVCIQRTLNLSIQLPKDESALLPLHTDVWSGNSPYEVVFWMPLVDCYNSKSMYVLPLKKSHEVFTNFSLYENMDAEQLYKHLEKDVVFLNVPKGHGVIFSHSVLHGNRINNEKETRWTFNIRFKSVLTPFGTKSLGETFIPINLRPATRIGFNNVIPKMSKHDEK